MVYAVQGKVTQKIKIGHTQNFEERLKTIQAHSPDVIEILGVWDVPNIVEKWFHTEFKESNSHGEWYKPTEKLLQCINTEHANAIADIFLEKEQIETLAKQKRKERKEQEKALAKQERKERKEQEKTLTKQERLDIQKTVAQSFFEMYKNGMTMESIGNSQGITRQRVQQLLSEHTDYLQFRKQKKREKIQAKERIKEQIQKQKREQASHIAHLYYNQGLPLGKIASQRQTSPATIIRILKKQGLYKEWRCQPDNVYHKEHPAIIAYRVWKTRKAYKYNRREFNQIFACLLTSKTILSEYRSEKLKREGFFDKDIPSTLNAKQQSLSLNIIGKKT